MDFEDLEEHFDVPGRTGEPFEEGRLTDLWIEVGVRRIELAILEAQHPVTGFHAQLCAAGTGQFRFTRLHKAISH